MGQGRRSFVSKAVFPRREMSALGSWVLCYTSQPSHTNVSRAKGESRSRGSDLCVDEVMMQRGPRMLKDWILAKSDSSESSCSFLAIISVQPWPSTYCLGEMGLEFMYKHTHTSQHLPCFQRLQSRCEDSGRSRAKAMKEVMEPIFSESKHQMKGSL